MSARTVKRAERKPDTSRVVLLHVSTAELSAPTWVIQRGTGKERPADDVQITVPRLTRPGGAA